MRIHSDHLLARAQIGLAFFYGVVFVLMFILLAAFWDRLSKMDVGLLTMFATGAMNQSKDAAAYFFARQRGDTASAQQPAGPISAPSADTSAAPAPSP